MKEDFPAAVDEVRVASQGGAAPPPGPTSTTKHSRARRCLGLIWDSVGDLDKRERRLVQKLDGIFLVWACFYYFVMYLDSTNISNAYVSGMKTDLKMNGNQLNVMTTVWTVGYIIGTLPSQFIQMRVRPSIWLPTLELIWGGLVMCMSAARSYQAIYGLRFLIGLCEASAYPGLMTLFTNWYTPRELGKRSVIYQQSSAVAQLFSGFLQAGIYKGMNGKSGLAGWRWLFIFDGVISIPIAVLGFWIIPDNPVNTRVAWLKEDDREVARERMVRVGRANPTGFSWRMVKKTFTHWPIWTFAVPYICFVLALHIASYFNLWLQSLKIYSVELINEIPSGGYALEIVSALLLAILSDALGKRWPSILIGSSFGILGGIFLSAWRTRGFPASFPRGLLFAGWMFTFVPVGTGALMFAWAAEICGDDAEERAVVVGFLNTAAYVFNAWVPLLLFPAEDAPKYRVGYQLDTVFWSVQFAGVLVILWFVRRYGIGLVRGGSAGDVEMIRSEGEAGSKEEEGKS